MLSQLKLKILNQKYSNVLLKWVKCSWGLESPRRLVQPQIIPPPVFQYISGEIWEFSCLPSLLLVREPTLRITGLWKQSEKNRMLGSRWVAKDEPNVARQRRKRDVPSCLAQPPEWGMSEHLVCWRRLLGWSSGYVKWGMGETGKVSQGQFMEGLRQQQRSWHFVLWAMRSDGGYLRVKIIFLKTWSKFHFRIIV